MAKYKVTQWVTASVPIVSYVEANSEEEAEENLSNNIGAGDWKYRYDKIHYGELESMEAEKVEEAVKEDDLKTQHGEELLNKVAMWIYHESSEPISEIEYLLKKSGAVGDYMDAVSESKEKVTEDDEEEKGPDHYRWKNDSQLAVVIGRLEGAMDELDNAIQYRGENSAKFFNNGDKAGVGNLMGIKQKLEDIHSDWNKNTEYYGM
jgi:hypothetical protein